MEKESEFKRLEQYVERLLENYAGVKAEKNRLEQDMAVLREENTRLAGELETLESERGEVSSRVGTLISRIERWESELDSEAGLAEVAPESEPDDDPGQEKMFVPANDTTDKLADVPDEDPEEEEERAGGVQTSLFTSGSTTTG